MARINNVSNYLSDVASAIKTKTGDNTSIQASDFDTKINNIETMQDMIGTDFTDLNLQKNFPVSNINYTYRYLPFYLLKEIPKMSLDFSDKSNLSTAFMYCFNLEKADLSLWNIGSINLFKSLFQCCYNLEEINLNNWDITGTSPDTTQYIISCLIKGCQSLKRVDLSCFKGAWVVGELAGGCTSLEHLDIRNLDLTQCVDVITSNANISMLYTTGTSASGGGAVPTTCEIIVADTIQKNFMATTFPDYTNVKTVTEYEAE